MPRLSETQARDLPAAARIPTRAGTTPGPSRFDTAGGLGGGPVLRSGQVLGGRFEVRAEVGGGGMGVV